MSFLAATPGSCWLGGGEIELGWGWGDVGCGVIRALGPGISEQETEPFYQPPVEIRP